MPLPVLAVLLTLTLGFLYVLLRPASLSRSDLEPHDLQIDRSPSDLTLTFETRSPGNPSLEYGSANGPLRLLREPGPPRTRHRFAIPGLTPDTRYTLRFVFPDGTRGPSQEVALPPVTLTRKSETYDPLKVELSFTSAPPIRCRVDAIPSARSTTATPLPILFEDRELTAHSVQVPLVVPGEPCTLRISLIRADAPPHPLAEWPIAGLAERLTALERSLAALDAPALIAGLVRRRATSSPDALAADTVRAVSRVRPALEQLLAFLPSALAHRGVGLREKLALYAIATPLLHLDAACDALTIPYETGVTRTLPPPFRLTRTAPGPKPARKLTVRLPHKDEPFVPATTPLALVEDGLPQNTLFKGEAIRSFTVAKAASYTRAALHVPVTSFNPQHMPELFFEVTLNRQTPLICRYDAAGARALPPRPGLWHTFDPRLLAEGRNEVIVRLKQTPGFSAPLGQVPLSRLEIWLWKDE